MEKQNYLIPLSIIIAGLLVAGGLYFGNVQKQQQEESKNIPEEKTALVEVNPVSENDYMLGNPNAKLILIEFSDLECPFCKIFHKTMHQVMEKFGKEGDVAWVYRHMPMEQLHAKAFQESEASECAGELGGKEIFFKYIDTIYDITPSNDGLDLGQLPQIAGDLGLDVEKFNACLSSGKYKEKIKAQFEDGARAENTNALFTPFTVVVNQKGEVVTTIKGAYPFAQVSSLLTEILKTL